MDANHPAVAALSLLRIGVVLVRADGEVLTANRSARCRIGRTDGVTLVGNRLQGGTASETMDLHRLIVQVARTGEKPREASMTLGRSPGRRPLAVVVKPLAPQGDGSNGAVAVFLCDPEDEVEAETGTLARLYGLTTAEARMARAMVRGKTVEEAARQFRVSRHTARTDLKHVLAKTKSRRQGDLMRLLLAGPALLHIA